MTTGPMAAALAPLRARMPPMVHERPILCVSAVLSDPAGEDSVPLARNGILAWAQSELGERLPSEAWQARTFESFFGGRMTLGVRIEGAQDIWALRCDIPDKTVPSRAWTTEVVIGRIAGGQPMLSVRLLATSPEEALDITPAVPRFLRDVARTCRLMAGDQRITSDAWRINSEVEADDLVALLESRSRALPVFVAAGDERTDDPARPLIDADALARATVGIAHVVVVPARHTYALSDAFGKVRSVYHGAARIYLPGFDSSADPYVHRLLLPERFGHDPLEMARLLRSEAARESLRRTRLGHDVVTFAAARSIALQIEYEARARSEASEADRIDAANHRIEELRRELTTTQGERDQAFDLAAQEEDRARAAETQLHNSAERIRSLEARLAAQGQDIDVDHEHPRTWSQVAEWCDKNLLGRLVLAPAARRGVKRPEFGDPALVARCLTWLATEARNRRIEGGGALEGAIVTNGVRNEPCGSDTFAFEFQGRRIDANWHIKNGGNTRDPARCLRIYYAWDQVTQQIVVADLPAHRRTGAS